MRTANPASKALFQRFISLPYPVRVATIAEPLTWQRVGMIKTFEGRTPVVPASVWIAETAFVLGDVEIGEGSSVWPGAVVRGDFSSIRIGSNTHIEDNVVVHCGEPLTIGDNVTAGHGVVIHCRSVGDNVLLGNNSTILDGAEIGSFCVVAAGAVVTPRTVVPEGSFVKGLPAVVEPISPERLERMKSRSNTDTGYAAMIKRYKADGL